MPAPWRLRSATSSSSRPFSKGSLVVVVFAVELVVGTHVRADPAGPVNSNAFSVGKVGEALARAEMNIFIIPYTNLSL